jgi:hypothetical protein
VAANQTLPASNLPAKRKGVLTKRNKGELVEDKRG